MTSESHPTEPVEVVVDLAPVGPVPSDRRGRGAPPWAPTVAFAVLVLVIAAVVAAVGGVAEPDRAPEATDGLAFDLDGGAPTAVAGPRDGLESKRHPIEVTPAEGLADGQVVTVRGSQFPPNEALGVVMCSSLGPSPIGGAANCELSPYTSVQSDANGSFEVQYAVRRHISLGNGTIDCAAPPPEGTAANCVVAVGAITDYDESGITPVTFDPGLPAVPPPSVEVGPAPPYTEGQEVTVTVRDAVPGSRWLVDLCAEGPLDAGGHGMYVCASYDAPLAEIVVGADGTATTVLVVGRGVEAMGVRADCADGLVRCSIEVSDRSGRHWFSFPVFLAGVAPPDTVPESPATTVPGTAPTTTVPPAAPPASTPTTSTSLDG